MIYVIIIIFSILIMLFRFLYIKSRRVIYIKKFAIMFFCTLFILCLISFSGVALDAAKKGISLCLNIVFPSLFPFFVGSELLYKTGIVKVMGVLFEPVMRPLFNVPGCASFPFAMGITSGYPIGAKLTVAMRKENLLTKLEAERLIAFTNNSGPLFIIGAVAVGMYNLPQLGFFLLTCHIAASITVGLLFGFYGKNKVLNLQKGRSNLFSKFKSELKLCLTTSQADFGTILGDAIKNSIGLLLSIGGFIIFFSVIIHLLLQTGIISNLSAIISYFAAPLGINKEIIPALLSGFFEITTGSSMVSKALNVPFIVQLTAASIIIGWAGLSVHTQVLSITSGSDINIKPYFLGKFLQGIIAGIYTYIFIKIAGTAFLEAKPAFLALNFGEKQNWESFFSASFVSFIICIIVLTLIAL